MTDPIRGQGTDGSTVEVIREAGLTQVRVDSDGDNTIDAVVVLMDGHPNAAYILANGQRGETLHSNELHTALARALPDGVLRPHEVHNIVDQVEAVVSLTGSLPRAPRSR